MKRRTNIIAVSASILMVVTLSAYAQGMMGKELVKINRNIKNIGSFLVDSTNQLVTWTTDMMFELDPAMGAAMASNQQYFQTKDQPSQIAASNSLRQIHERLRLTNNNNQSNIYNTLARLSFDVPSSGSTIPKVLQQEANIFGRRNAGQPKGKQCYYKYLKKLKSKKNLHADNFFNFSTLARPSGFDKNHFNDCQAKTFIKYLANMNPGLEKNLKEVHSKISKKLQQADNKKKMLKSLRQDKDLVKKIYQARSRLAARSVALNNLYYMLAERQRIKGAGHKAGMQQKDASPLEIKEHAANQRVDSKEWYREMAKASPATVNREMLFVLAEMRQQMHEMHKDNERLMASMSVMDIVLAGFFSM